MSYLIRPVQLLGNSKTVHLYQYMSLQFAARQSQSFGKQPETSIPDTSVARGPDVDPMVLENALGGFKSNFHGLGAVGHCGCDSGSFRRATAGSSSSGSETHKEILRIMFLLWKKIATECIIVFNISILLACKVCRVQMLFWLLRLH